LIDLETAKNKNEKNKDGETNEAESLYSSEKMFNREAKTKN
jgi:hypothetical protein